MIEHGGVCGARDDLTGRPADRVQWTDRDHIEAALQEGTRDFARMILDITRDQLARIAEEALGAHHSEDKL